MSRLRIRGPRLRSSPPLDADRFHEKVILHVQKCPRKGKIRVEVRHEGVGLRRVDEEDHPARRSLPCMVGKLLEVFQAALRDGVGEHGDAAVEKRAGLDLEEKLPPAPRKEEVITARPGGSLAADDPVLLEPGEPSRCEQAGHHVVGEVRVQQDGPPVPLDGKRRVRDALARPGRVFHEIEEPPRKQQLPEPAGVGQVGPDGLSAQAAEDDKTVGPSDEPGLQEGRCERNSVERRERVHGIIRPDGCSKGPGRRAARLASARFPAGWHGVCRATSSGWPRSCRGRISRPRCCRPYRPARRRWCPSA